MNSSPLCDPYIWESPAVVVHTRLFGFRQRTDGPCASELVNQIVLLYIVALLLGLTAQVVLQNPMSLSIGLGLGTAAAFPAFWGLWTLRAKYGTPVEGFQTLTELATQKEVAQKQLEAQRKEETERLRTIADQKIATGDVGYTMYDVIGAGGGSEAKLTLPAARNPFMNVLVDELKYRPRRAMAASVYDPSVKVALDDFFRTDFFKDPTDVFGRSQGQRQFVTMPSTSIPNDQDSYQNWLYRIPGKTCKEGGREACMPGTDGGALPWLNVNP